MAGKVGQLRPPFIWMPKIGLQEAPHLLRWTPQQIREMKNGTYDWSKHQEVRA